MPLTLGMKNIKDYRKKTSIVNFRLTDIVPSTIPSYYRYSGSLTTPGCTEIVTWNVVDPAQSVLMSEDQLVEFQTMRDANGHEVSVSNVI